jgi:hypothetical protein
VKGLGDQATVIFRTVPDTDSKVELDVWSGNAVIQMVFDSDPTLDQTPSRATMLATDVAMVRDALTRLRRT